MFKQLSVVIFVISLTTVNILCITGSVKSEAKSHKQIIWQEIKSSNETNETSSRLTLPPLRTAELSPQVAQVISSGANKSVKQLFCDKFNENSSGVKETQRQVVKSGDVKRTVKKNLSPIDPLILNHFIATHKWREGRRAALVTHLPGLQAGCNLFESYAAWITVDRVKQLNAFFWFFPSLSLDGPLIVSIEGNSHESSLFQVFHGSGPYKLTPELTVLNRNSSWINFASILYIDLPSMSDEGVPITSSQSAGHLFNMLQIFLPFFPNSFLNGIYFMCTDESIRIVMQSIRIFEKKFSLYQMKIKGVIAINPIISPAFQFSYLAKYLFNNGLIDWSEYSSMKSDLSKLRRYMKNEKFERAYKMYHQLLGGDETCESKFKQFTGYTNDGNLVEPFSGEHFSLYKVYLEQSRVRLALNGYQSVSFDVSDGCKVTADSLDYRDVMLDIGHVVRDHLSRYQVLSLTGNLNIALPCQSVVGVFNQSLSNCSDNLNDSGKLYFHSPVIGAPTIHGYLYSACNATVIVVLNAGDQVIADQTLFVYHAVQTFLSLHTHDVYSVAGQ